MTKATTAAKARPRSTRTRAAESRPAGTTAATAGAAAGTAAEGDTPGGDDTSPGGPSGGWQRTLLEGLSAEDAFNERLRAAAERLAAQRLE